MRLLSFLITLSILACIAQCAGKAYCTYHLYYQTQPLTTVACSDGANGLISWGYSTLQPMFPYVAAWDKLKWNDVKCGTCISLTFNSKTIHFTALDQCGGPSNGTDTHFDISKEAFYEIFGQAGIDKGSMIAAWDVATPSMCKGNRKKAQQSDLIA